MAKSTALGLTAPDRGRLGTSRCIVGVGTGDLGSVVLEGVAATSGAGASFLPTEGAGGIAAWHLPVLDGRGCLPSRGTGCLLPRSRGAICWCHAENTDMEELVLMWVFQPLVS